MVDFFYSNFYWSKTVNFLFSAMFLKLDHITIHQNDLVLINIIFVIKYKVFMNRILYTEAYKTKIICSKKKSWGLLDGSIIHCHSSAHHDVEFPVKVQLSKRKAKKKFVPEVGKESPLICMETIGRVDLNYGKVRSPEQSWDQRSIPNVCSTGRQNEDFP